MRWIPVFLALAGVALAAEASEAFRAVVARLAIKGAHPEGRILVDYGNHARLYRCGDVVDEKLGIKLHAFSVEGGTAVLVFQDQTGAQVSRKVGIRWKP
ncbi:MAG: hypothetical protein HZA93_09945 [Verrucomicrobia bacterium]|nr:hypothetical protein [Verrucomicrobiota bacterium]